MSDNPLDRIPAYNRVSIRAVLVREGEDPGPALAAAGILDPVAVPVVVGEHLDLAGGILGDGITPNLVCVLETEGHDDFDPSPGPQPGLAASRPDVEQGAESFTGTAPAAFGQQSLAPIRGLGGTRFARYGGDGQGLPPTPGQSLETSRTPAGGWRQPPSCVRFDPCKYSSRVGATARGDADAAGADTSKDVVATESRDGQRTPEPTSPTGNVISPAAYPNGSLTQQINQLQ